MKRRSGKSFTISVFIGLLGGAVGTALVGLFSGNTNTGDGTLTAMDKATIGLVYRRRGRSDRWVSLRSVLLVRVGAGSAYSKAVAFMLIGGSSSPPSF